MALDSMDIDNSSSSGRSYQSLALIENPEVLNEFAQALYNIKQKGEGINLFTLVQDFHNISGNQVEKLLESKYALSDDDKEVLENWVLETKFWDLVDKLINYRFSPEYNEREDRQFDEFTSHQVIKLAILDNNNKLNELDVINFWLTHNMALDEENDQEFNQADLTSTKWLNTKIDLQSNARKPDMVSTLDSDAVLRNNVANKRLRKTNEKDLKSDALFFEIVFKLLLEEKYDEIKELCSTTNNWTLSMILAGADDYVDPEIEGLNDEYDDETMDIEPPKTTGIKNKLLWRRTVYLLSNNPNLSKYEKAVYSFLSGDYRCAELVSSWERQLLVYTNNILQYDLEEELVQNLNTDDLIKVLKLSRPEKKCQSINEALNYLSQSSNEIVRKQSSHSIRVLMGSIITNNVEQLIGNSINLLDGLILLNDKFRNSSVLTTNNTNNLIKESYLLRILIHFIIFMKFLNYNIITDENLIKLIKLYVTRLSLYKLYDLIPIYIFYIPSQEEIVENYSFFLSNIIINKADRLTQLKHMRNLELPLENILKKTVKRIFEDTEQYYTGAGELNQTPVTRLDNKLIESINWYVDSKLLLECVSSTIELSRRFLIHGKLTSFIQLYQSFDFTAIVNNYRIESNIMDEFANGETLMSLNKVDEIVQLQFLERAIKLINEYDQQSMKDPFLKSLRNVIQSIYPLITDWLKNLTENSTNEDMEFYHTLKSMYLPYVIFKAFKIIKENQSKELFKDFKNLVLMISDEQYQIYAIFKETGKLSELLKTVADISTDLLIIG